MKKAFLVGIKGVGMTALALILKEQGWSVQGSDVTDQTFVTDQALAQAHIPVFDFQPDHLNHHFDLVIYSGAYHPQKHPQLLRAQTLNLPLKTQQQALADLTQTRHLIAVAGVGGKTTTSALLAHLFHQSGQEVGYFVGAGTINHQAKPGAWGSHSLFIAEADEYANNLQLDPTPKLLLLQPQEIVLPNLQFDHPDIYQSPQQTLTTFAQFIAKLPNSGRLYFNTDSQFIHQLLDQLSSFPQTVSIGFHSSADWQIQSLQYHQAKTIISLTHQNQKYQLESFLFGQHNARNLVLAAAVCLQHGLDWSQIQAALATFKGVGRRQEYRGQINGALFYDDYGHHPAEIKVTLQAFKQRFPQRRLWVFFESHTYTRTLKLLPEFIEALSLADQLTILPIFASAREKQQPPSITHQDLADKLRQQGKPAQALSFAEAEHQLKTQVQPNDLILTLGAGIVYQLHDKLFNNHD